MLDSGLHRVRRLRWQARAPTAADAFALQSLLHRRSDEVSAAIEQAFAGIETAGEDWHLPSLTLRLDASSLAQMDADLPALVASALRLALQAAAPTGPAEPAPMSAGLKSIGVADADADADADVNANANACRRTSPADSAHAALRHYLATASLPWELAGLSTDAQQQALQGAAKVALEALLAQSSNSSAALATLTELIGATTTPLPARLGALLRCLPLLSRAQRQRWLAHSPRPTGPGLSLALVDGWHALLASPDGALEWLALWLVWPTTALPTTLPTNNPADGSPDAIAVAGWLADRPANAGNTAVGADHQFAVALQQALGDTSGRRAAAAAAPAPPPHHPSTAQTQAIASTPNTQLVPLAGLLLLHPYLPRLLKGCGLVEHKGHKSAGAITDAQLPRACALLHALACGDAEAAEHQLPFIKLLLGRAPDTTLTGSLPRPTAADQEEIDSLLGAVRSHWTALGNTSIDGLRLSFLQRRGLLRRADGLWQMQMQAEGFDRLLDLLPWSISLVKLPWMPLPLMVDWHAP